MKSILKQLILVLSTFLGAHAAEAKSPRDECYSACEEGAKLATKLCEIYKDPDSRDACWLGRNNSEAGCNKHCQEKF